MDLQLRSVLDHGLTETAELLNQGFADYIVRVELSVPALLQMIRQDSVGVTSSRIVLRDGQPVGVGLIARRGWGCRLAGMALIPEARGQGVGRWLMEQLLAEAKGRGERTMALEVIKENTPGVRLYESCGFRLQRHLVSYALSQPEETVPTELEDIDVRELGRMVTAYGLPDLPWQISGESLAQMGPPNRAYKLKAAYAAISDPDESHVVIRAVVVEPASRGQGQAIQLLQGMMAFHPQKVWRVPALCPEEIGGLFEKAGFERGSLSQLQMIRDMTGEHG
jgi:ribosomal protein S18 acetylase RimI-like enzyme